MASLMPLQRSVTPWKVNSRCSIPSSAEVLRCVCAQTPPQIRPFVQEDFLSTLEHAGPQLTSPLRGDWVGLYR